MPVPIETVTSHHIALNQTSNIVDVNTSQPFDVVGYSEMKYGNRQVTRLFAAELVSHLVEARPGLVEDETPPLFTSAYKAVPHVPYYLARYSLDVINDMRADGGNEPGQTVQVHKSRAATTNYAVATEKERDDEWDSMDFSLDDERGDAPTVVLDDIRITGSAERKILSAFKNTTPELMLLGYVAILDPAQAAERPSIENEINGTSKKGVEDLIPIVKSDNFDLNVRTLKMILSTNPDSLRNFLAHCSEGLVEQMLRGTVESGADFMDYYSEGYQHLQEASRE
jgi:hypothetical protein